MLDFLSVLFFPHPVTARPAPGTGFYWATMNDTRLHCVTDDHPKPALSHLLWLQLKGAVSSKVIQQLQCLLISFRVYLHWSLYDRKSIQQPVQHMLLLPTPFCQFQHCFVLGLNDLWSNYEDHLLFSTVLVLLTSWIPLILRKTIKKNFTLTVFKLLSMKKFLNSNYNFTSTAATSIPTSVIPALTHNPIISSIQPLTIRICIFCCHFKLHMSPYWGWDWLQASCGT